MRSFLLRLAFSATLLADASGAGQAQAPAPPEQAPLPVSSETRAARAKLDALKAQLDQNDAALARDLNDTDLQRIRQEVDPLWQSTRAIIDEIQPRLEAARARLDQLGPKPKDAAAESPDVQRDRGEREAAVAELDETQRLARALLVQAEQITAQTSDRRRAAFARSLLQRTSGILSPDLWSAVMASLPRDMRAMRLLFENWSSRIEENARPGCPHPARALDRDRDRALRRPPLSCPPPHPPRPCGGAPAHAAPPRRHGRSHGGRASGRRGKLSRLPRA